MPGTLASVNVAVPGTLTARGRPIRTGIFKHPVPGRVALGRLGLEGDFQADKRYHGGPRQAVYAYSAEYAAEWTGVLGLPAPPSPGYFGENFTTRGLTEDGVAVGDVYRIGTAAVSVTKPRSPCFKLGLRAGSSAFVRRFLQSGHLGFYLSVVQEGEVGAGDPVALADRPSRPLFLSELVSLLYFQPADPVRLARAIEAGGLSDDLRGMLAKSLDAARGALL